MKRNIFDNLNKIDELIGKKVVTVEPKDSPFLNLFATSITPKKQPEFNMDEMIKMLKPIRRIKIIKEIRVGKLIFAELKKVVVSIPRRVGSLYGVKFIIDKTLKPRQFRIVK